jgi:hypothetical protein
MKLTTLALAVTGFAVANAQFGCNVDKVICCINNYRAKYGLKALNKDTAICRACQQHSQDMSRRHNLDHDGANGSSAGTRMRNQGVSVGAWAENIASGQKTEEAVCAAWIKSPGHRRNIVGDYDAVCVARYGDYWTQDFVNYSGSGGGTPVRCNGGSAPVASHTSPSTGTPPTVASTPSTVTRTPSTVARTPSTVTSYRKVLYRKTYVSDGHTVVKYYYKLVPVHTRAYHDAEGDHTHDTPYDVTDVQDVAEDYEPEDTYETAIEPAADEPGCSSHV